MKKKRLQYGVILFGETNRAETDCQPQPVARSTSLPYLQEPNKTKGSENAIQANSQALF